jgi:hypothetical protein
VAARKDVYAILVATELPPPRRPGDRFIPASRLAVVLGVDVETVYHASQRGELPRMGYVERVRLNRERVVSYGFDLLELAAWQHERPVVEPRPYDRHNRRRPTP